MDERTAQRFWAKVAIGPPEECWEWQGGRFTRGYGGFSYEGRTQQAHRVVMGMDKSDPRVVMHLCDNPPCVNPDHLRIGTQAENMHDKISRGRCGMGGCKCALADYRKALILKGADIGFSDVELARAFTVCLLFVRRTRGLDNARQVV